MNKTSIEWTDFTWNPIRARNLRSKDKRTGTFCTRISPGCKNCYASVINRRFGTGDEYEVPNLAHHEFYIDDRILEEPLRRKKPARIFVGDMFDLFHEAILDQFIDAVVAAAAFADWHTFQFLTKRADRMRAYFQHLSADNLRDLRPPDGMLHPWPFQNFWLGVSVESQQYADERIPLLLQTPAAVRFLSVEPQLEAIDLNGVKSDGWWIECPQCEGTCSEPANNGGGKPCGRCFGKDGLLAGTIPGISWVICGGESGPGARPFNLAWAESLLKQCRAAGVSFFMKQVGSNAGIYMSVDRKGGDPAEWPESLRVREFPSTKAAMVSA
jgi:protein gp37